MGLVGISEGRGMGMMVFVDRPRWRGSGVLPDRDWSTLVDIPHGWPARPRLPLAEYHSAIPGGGSLTVGVLSRMGFVEDGWRWWAGMMVDVDIARSAAMGMVCSFRAIVRTIVRSEVRKMQ